MPKHTIVIEVDVPEGYEVTGEYRKPRYGEPFLGRNGVVEAKSYHHDPRIILRKLPDPIPEVEGPIGWPELKWAVKTSTGNVFCSVQVPKLSDDGSEYIVPFPRVLARDIGWAVPPEISDAPYDQSLVKLTHECKWKPDGQDQCYRLSCSCRWFSKESVDAYPNQYKYCPECGRKVRLIQS